MKYLMILLLTSVLSFQGHSTDYKKEFNKALREIKNENYQSALQLLKSADSLKQHSKIVFWMSYVYAQLDQKELSLAYARLSLEYEPELNEEYEFKANQLINWGNSSRDSSVSGRFPASDDPPYFEVTNEDKL